MMEGLRMSVGLLVVSFGTTHLDTLEKTIEAVEKDLAGAYPEARFYRAFTSGVVRRRLKNEYGISVDSVKEAMARMQRDSVQRLVVQPTLLIPGEEYDRLRSEVMTYAGDMEVSMGLPLLWDDSDLDQMIGILAKSYPVPEDTVLLAMGHGTEHGANSLYTRLAQRMHRHHGNSIAVCTVEGQPDFSDVVAELKKQPKRKAHLIPLLLVSGEHSKNDMAGEESGSLRVLLEQAGFTVSWSLRGLGELPAVRQRYVRRAENAFQSLVG